MTTTETTTESADAHDDHIQLRRDGAPPLRFKGTLSGIASSHSHSGPSNSRWTEIRIYETVSGKAVLSIIGHTLWQGESMRYAAIVVPVYDGPAITKALADQNDGYLSDVAKEVLDDAGLDYAEDLE